MATVDTLLVRIEADMSDLRKQLNKTTQAVNKSVKTQQGAFTALGKTLKGVGIVAAGVMAVRFGASMIKMASSAEEMRGKSSVVFGQFADDVRSQLEDFGNIVGRSTFELEGMASSIQDTFVPMGFARGEAAKLSVELTKLAVDVASFNNASDMDTMRAFQSALVGNHETVRRFGVIITEATLQQELFRMGITKNSKDVDNAQKVQARMNLILAGTTDAQGDAERTAGSFANSMKALSGAFEELVVEAVLPALPALASFVQALTSATVETKEFLKFIGIIGPDLTKSANVVQLLSKKYQELALMQKRSKGLFGGTQDSIQLKNLRKEIKLLEELRANQEQVNAGKRRQITIDKIKQREENIAQGKLPQVKTRKEGLGNRKGEFQEFAKIQSATRDLANANQLLQMQINGRTEAEIRLQAIRNANFGSTELQLSGLFNQSLANEELKDSITRKNNEEKNTLSLNKSVISQLESLSNANEILQMQINGSTDAEIKKHKAMMANIGASPEFLAVLNNQIELEAQLNKELEQKNLLEGMEVDRKNRLRELTESLLTPS